MKHAVSVVINTLNEEGNLPYALRSVCGWADEIVVVDMHSDDRTVEIARQYGAKVYYHERIVAFDSARRFAIEQATNDWVLLLDADEVVPFALSQRLLEIAANDQADIVRIPWLNYLLGAPLAHTGWGPKQDKHQRFFKKSMIRATSRIHAYLTPVSDKARAIELLYEKDGAIVHFSHFDSTQFIEKLNRYTTIEAQQAYDRGERESFLRLFRTISWEFYMRYLRQRGFVDGWRGFYLSLLMVFYRVATFVKLKELATIGTRPQIVAHYRAEAEKILTEGERASRSPGAADARAPSPSVSSGADYH